MNNTQRRVHLSAVSGIAVLGVALLSGCVPTSSIVHVVDAAPEPIELGVIHALEADPLDGSLYIAAHTGLWRAGYSDGGVMEAPQPISTGTDLTSIAALPDGTLVGAPEELDGSTVLGSTDGGATWRTISAEGFIPSLLDVSGERLIGYDAENDTLRSSDDLGITWTELGSIRLRDLTIASSDSSRMWVLGEANLSVSSDGGASFAKVANTPALAWIAAGGTADHPSELIALSTKNRVWLRESDDEAWRAQGRYVGSATAMAYFTGDAPYLAIVDERGLMMSSDLGYRWTALTEPTSGAE